MQAGSGLRVCLVMLCASPAQYVLASHQTTFLADLLSEGLSVLCAEVCLGASTTGPGAGNGS